MRFASRVGFIGVAAITAVGLGAMPAQAAPHNHTIWVNPGTGTISAAVASAQPGDTIRLEKGVLLTFLWVAGR